LQELYERFLELANGQPVQRAHVEVAMGRHLEIPRAGALQTAGAWLLHSMLQRPVDSCLLARLARAACREAAAYIVFQHLTGRPSCVT
jgi:uncharacterized protein (DUF1810 family)